MYPLNADFYVPIFNNPFNNVWVKSVAFHYLCLS